MHSILRCFLLMTLLGQISSAFRLKVHSGAICRCHKTEAYVFAKPGENQALVYWREPEFACPMNFTRKKISPHDITSPARFSLGAHTITYSFWFNSLEKPVKCPIEVQVYSCNCPSTKTVKSRVRSGATKALVSWEEPEPFCEIVPHASNPQSTSEWLPIGYYKRTYKYTVGSGLPSFDMECHVNIIVTGKSCDDATYNKATQACCAGKVRRKKSGYKCCGKKYYNPQKKYCCQAGVVARLGKRCPTLF